MGLARSTSFHHTYRIYRRQYEHRHVLVAQYTWVRYIRSSLERQRRIEQMEAMLQRKKRSKKSNWGSPAALHSTILIVSIVVSMSIDMF